MTKIEEAGGKLYDALKAVQIALYNGEDEDMEQIEQALIAWEKRFLPGYIDCHD